MPKRKQCCLFLVGIAPKLLQLYHAKAETRPKISTNSGFRKRCNFTMPKRKPRKYTPGHNQYHRLQLYHAKAETFGSIVWMDKVGQLQLYHAKAETRTLTLWHPQYWRQVATLPCQSGNMEGHGGVACPPSELQLYHAKAETWTNPARCRLVRMLQLYHAKAETDTPISLPNHRAMLQLYHAKAETDRKFQHRKPCGWVATLPCQSGNV